MKRKILALVLAAALMMSGLCGCSKAADGGAAVEQKADISEITIAKLVEKNTKAALLTSYNSVKLTFADAKAGNQVDIYLDKEMDYAEIAGYQQLITGGNMYICPMGDYADIRYESSDGTEFSDPIMDPTDDKETIVETKEEAGKYIVTTAYSTEDTAAYLQGHGASYAQGDVFTNKYTVDPNTCAILECEGSIRHSDNSVEITNRFGMVTDAQRPQGADEFLGRITNGG